MKTFRRMRPSDFILPAIFAAMIIAMMVSKSFAVEGTYVPDNNFTVEVQGRMKLPQAFGVTFPDVRFNFSQVNVPANDAPTALAMVISAVGNLGYTIDAETGEAMPNGVTIIIDAVSASRQSGPITE